MKESKCKPQFNETKEVYDKRSYYYLMWKRKNEWKRKSEEKEGGIDESEWIVLICFW